MIPSSPNSERDTATTEKPVTGNADAAEMEVEEPFAADFGDDKMEHETE